MKTLADIKRRIAVGQVLYCVENTKQPNITGTRRRVAKVQTVAFMAHLLDGPADLKDRPFWTYHPKARDCLIIDADTFRFPIGKGHSVTLRFEAPRAAEHAS